MQWHHVRKGFIAFLRKYCLREGVPWKENDLSVGACSGDLVRVCLFSTCVTSGSGGSGAGGQGASGSEEGIKHGGARWTCVHVGPVCTVDLCARWALLRPQLAAGQRWCCRHRVTTDQVSKVNRVTTYQVGKWIRISSDPSFQPQLFLQRAGWRCS